jgi:hypothetical protein
VLKTMQEYITLFQKLYSHSPTSKLKLDIVFINDHGNWMLWDTKDKKTLPL